MPTYYVKNRKIQLGRNCYISQGGEAQIFGLKGLIYKVYHKVANMIHPTKIRELQSLNHPQILAPVDLLTNQNKKPVGFTMKWVTDTVPLCRLFPTVFRNKNGVTPESTLELVENMKEIIEFIHSKDCIMVDGNEMNYLVREDWVTPYCIDVNSYQTQNFPATVIMPSIRDWYSKEFSPLTDWFSFAIVSCQLFLGIHPFKGSHKKFQKGDLKSRMKANISIFNRGVSVPGPTRDFSNIPPEYQQWYIREFEDGKRLSPPGISKLGAIIAPTYTIEVKTSGNFTIREIAEFDDFIIYHKTRNCSSITTTKNKKIYIDKLVFNVSSLKTDILFTKFNKIAVTIKRGNQLELKDIKTNKILSTIGKVSNKVIVDNDLYLLYGGRFTQYSLMNDNAGDILFVPVGSWDVMPNSVQALNGFLYQSVLGKACLVIPEPDSRACYMPYVPELDEYRVLNGKRMKNVVGIMGRKIGEVETDQIILRFDSAFKTYDCWIVKNVECDFVNFVVMDSGITLLSDKDGELKVFSANPKNSRIELIKDTALSRAILTTDGLKAMFFRDNKLFSFQMIFQQK